MQQQDYCFFVQLAHNVVEEFDDEDDDNSSGQCMPQREEPSEFVCRRVTETTFIREIPADMLDSIGCSLHFKFSRFDNTYRDDEDWENSEPIRGKSIQGLPELLAESGFGISFLGEEDDDDLVPPAMSDYQKAFLHQIKFTSWDHMVEIIFTQYGCGIQLKSSSEWSKIRNCVHMLVSALKTFDPAVDITAVISTYQMRGLELDMNESAENYVSTPPINQPDNYLNTLIDAICMADGYELRYRCVVDANPIIGALFAIDKVLCATFAVEYQLNSNEPGSARIADVPEILDVQKRFINLMFWDLIKDKWLQRREQQA
jgi:hypothetical protein